MTIYITADTHFGHANMIPYCGRPKDFDNLLIENWNKTVKPEDMVIHLGDVIMGQDSANRLLPIMSQLNGKKILCRGNHDVEKKWGSGLGFVERGFDFACDYFVYDRYVFSHCPITPLPRRANRNWTDPVELNIHAHFHNKIPTIPEPNDDFYDSEYYLENPHKYQLVQIEDTLAPFSLEEVIGQWLSRKEVK